MRLSRSSFFLFDFEFSRQTEEKAAAALPLTKKRGAAFTRAPEASLLNSFAKGVLNGVLDRSSAQARLELAAAEGEMPPEGKKCLGALLPFSLCLSEKQQRL
jgi:hypothetical protein